MAPLQRVRGFQFDRKGVQTVHQWWSVEYETAANGTTQQYKGKM